MSYSHNLSTGHCMVSGHGETKYLETDCVYVRTPSEVVRQLIKAAVRASERVDHVPWW